MFYKFFSPKKIIVFSVMLFLCAVSAFVFQSSLMKIHKKIAGSLILNSLKGYNIKKSVNCDIYFTLKDKETAELTDVMISTYFPILANDFDLKPNKPVIIIYPNKKEMKKVLGEIGEAPMGAYYSGIIHILSPQIYLKDNQSLYYDYIKKGPVVHEMVHYFIDEKTDGKYYIWFSEGAALYYEYKYLGCEWHGELNGKTEHITIDNLKKGFNNIDKTQAYRRSFEIIKAEMEEKDGSFICSLCEKYLKP